MPPASRLFCATLVAMWSGDDIYFMKLALEEAEKADRLDEVPVGAVLVSVGALLGRGHNHPM
jgi:tRNA(adenine34) deaminase